MECPYIEKIVWDVIIHHYETKIKLEEIMEKG